MKTQKMAVVTQIKHNYRQYQGNSGDPMCVHLITFDNGDEGEYHSTAMVCSEFVKGEIGDYSIEERGFRNGKPENRIKPLGNGNRPASQSNSSSHKASGKGDGTKRPPFNNNAPGRSNRNENAIMSQHALTKSIELFAAGGIKATDLYPKALEMLQWTHKYGNMSVEEILNTPVVFNVTEKGKGKGKAGKNGTGKAELF